MKNPGTDSSSGFADHSFWLTLLARPFIKLRAPTWAAHLLAIWLKPKTCLQDIAMSLKHIIQTQLSHPFGIIHHWHEVVIRDNSIIVTVQRFFKSFCSIVNMFALLTAKRQQPKENEESDFKSRCWKNNVWSLWARGTFLCSHQQSVQFIPKLKTLIIIVAVLYLAPRYKNIK